MATTMNETPAWTAGDRPPAAYAPEMSDQVGTSTRTPGWDLATERRIDDGRTLARGLGWFSLALGLAEVVAGGRMSRWFGLRGRSPLLRAYGLREIGTGVGVLGERRPEGWIWARIAGDVLDLGTLSTGLTKGNRRRGRLWGAIAAVAGVGVLDVLCAAQLRASASRHAA